MIRRFEAGEYPFQAGWERWRPAKGVPLPALPQTWDADFETHLHLPRTDD